jgi:hypothetical protein
MVGNRLTPTINAACLRLEKIVKLTKEISETNANKSKFRVVVPLAFNCVFYEDILKT